jgi:hypothetical protein
MLRWHGGNLLLIVIVVGLAWLATRYSWQSDWTEAGRNSLSPPTIGLLAQLGGPVIIDAYLPEAPRLRQHVADLVARYQEHKPNIMMNVLSLEDNPQQVRELAIHDSGELFIRYEERRERVRVPSEKAITNALHRLARSADRWLVFLEGHGERNPMGQANHDLQNWGRQLQEQGYHIRHLNLAQASVIPENTALLVIASPQVNLLPGEVKLINEYIDAGGNLLWLAEPGGLKGLEPLARALGIRFTPGTIVDPSTRMLGIDNPAMALAAEYGEHAITNGFNTVTVFPYAAGVEVDPASDWQTLPLVMTAPQSWGETDTFEGEVVFDQGRDSQGPLSIAQLLLRDKVGQQPAGQQRVIVVGDGDFLANSYIGNAGNVQLSLRMVNWLSQDDSMIELPVQMAADRNLTLSKTQVAVIGLGSLVVLPVLLLALGMVIWWRRARR